ncbi:hypothetical protein [Arthrobacter sp. Y81]|uniref:IS1096 element passenger TnpR family protein n=1 Tax=Arthrobacter sp. Y81 TaxID=2058897 RepID=UPI0035BE78A9
MRLWRQPASPARTLSRRPANEGTPPDRLIDGARRGPLEDSSEFPGYEEIMDALADPSHPATVGKATALIG